MIKKEDLRQIAYAEWGLILDKLMLSLIQYSTDNNMCFDVIAPILRSGGFTGLHIASKMKIKHILPIQYKYFYKPTETIKKMFEIPKMLELDETKVSNILITDSNTVSGGIANIVIDEIHKFFPKSNLFFASANLDYSFKKPLKVKDMFYGQFSNESRVLSYEDANLKGITNEVIIFPWENLEEQWEEISGGI